MPKVKPVYACTPFPQRVEKTIFLAGPTPRTKAQSWRTEALALLEQHGFDGHVFIPEPDPETTEGWAEDYMRQLRWEEEGLKRADIIVFWVPRDLTGARGGPPLPGFTTNDEWGAWKASGKVVWGSPPWADHVRYQRRYAERLGVPIATTLDKTLQNALEKMGDGAERQGGEATVPLMVWRREDFQSWYQSQKDCGNTLNRADVVWTFWVGENRQRLFLYALHADVHIAKEGRDKKIEVLVVRPDISTVCLHRGDKVVLVREFRTPVRNSESYVYELPGGSSLRPGIDARTTAAEEVFEETGLRVDPSRLKPHGGRQMGATLCAYHAYLFSCELTQAELDRLEADHSVHGEPGGEERTTIVVKTLSEIRQEDLADWPTLGMIQTCLS